MSTTDDLKGTESTHKDEDEFKDMPPLEEVPLPSTDTTSSSCAPLQERRDGWVICNDCYVSSINIVGFEDNKEL